jgi:hypothetical protein
MSPRNKALLALGALAALTALQLWRLDVPAAVPADAPAATFSAKRAIATLRAVSLDEPHPMATPAHDAIRDRIVAEMTGLGYDVEIQRTFACNEAAVCGDVANIIATAPGQPRGRPAIAIVAHYDSVPAGPGASDDGTGVATVIEVARALRHEKLANPIVFLIDDGEEAGLLGAEGFLAEPARANDVAFIINLEARGTSGTPFLFETSRDNRWLISLVARELPRPVTTSLFATIYEMLPNDTDLTVFKRLERAGINFAYLGDATQYHTPLDNFANIDEGSVQQRGDQVLAMARAFGAADLAASPGDAVWFDVFTVFVVWWPASWSLWIAVLAIAVLAAAIVLGVRRGDATVAGVLVGVAGFVATVALAFGLGAVLARLLGLRAPGALFVPNAGPAIAAAWLAGLTAALAVVALAGKRASFDALVLGYAVAWNALAVALAILLPGGAYIAIVPGAVLAGLALLRRLAHTGEAITSLGTLVVAAVVYLPFGLVLHDALGGGSIAVIATLLALVGTTFAPMLAMTARRLSPALFAATVVLAVIAMLVPNTSPTHPRHLSLAYVSDSDTATARWQADPVPPMLGAAARFESTPQSIEPWFARPRFTRVAPAPTVGLDPPQVQVAAAAGDATRTATLDISSARRASRLTIAWRTDAALASVRVNGAALPPIASRYRSVLAAGWHRIAVRGPSARLEITTRGDAPVEARDISGAVPVHDGDVTTVQRRVTW